MDKYNYLVYGAGRCGCAAVYDLIKNCDAGHISVVDPVQGAVVAAYQRLKPVLDKLNPHWEHIVKFHKSEPPDNEMGGFHVALSCAPYRFNQTITEKCVRCKIPICDLGGNPDVVASQEEFATGKQIPVVPDCGIAPGIANIYATHLAKTGAKTVEVRCGGLPLKPPKNDLKYKLFFNLYGLISEYTGDVPIIKNGAVDSIPARSVVEDHLYCLAGSDENFECSPTSNNSQIAKWLQELGVENYNYMTIRYPGHWAEVEGWDFDDTDALADELSQNKSLKYDPNQHRDRLILMVTGDDITESIDLKADTLTKFSAMEMATSWGITTVAHWIAQRHMLGHVKKHVERGELPEFALPERFVDGEWMIAEVQKRLKDVAQ